MAGLERKNYTHLFFDLDHTLWDYNRNAGETLEELFIEFQLEEYTDYQSEEFIQVFYQVNNSLWEQFHKGKIPKENIRRKRFYILQEELGIDGFSQWESFQDAFIESCPKKGHLFPGTIKTLDVLKERFQMNLITNGFRDIQSRKIKYSGLTGYFDNTITSEIASSQKPHPDIFHFAFRQSNASPETSLMIGDDQHSDIYGAKEVNMDQVLFNPEKRDVHQTPTYEINKIEQLIDILEK